MERQPCVYILVSKKRRTLYTGVTSNLVKRIGEHKNNLVAGFPSRYSVHNLVWYEMSDTMDSVIQKEKEIKNWKRVWKIELVEQSDPDWCDLYFDII